MRRGEHRIGVAVRFPASERADVRRGDADDRVFRRRRRALHEFAQRFASFLGIVGIGRTGVRRLALRRRFEFVEPGNALCFEMLILQETSLAERVDQMFFEFADLDFARDPHQVRPEIQAGLLAIKARQALHQLRGNKQHGVGKLQRVANEKPGMLWIGGRDKIESQPQPGKWTWHNTTIAWPHVTIPSDDGLASPSRGFANHGVDFQRRAVCRVVLWRSLEAGRASLPSASSSRSPDIGFVRARFRTSGCAWSVANPHCRRDRVASGGRAESGVRRLRESVVRAGRFTTHIIARSFQRP